MPDHIIFLIFTPERETKPLWKAFQMVSSRENLPLPHTYTHTLPQVKQEQKMTVLIDCLVFVSLPTTEVMPVVFHPKSWPQEDYKLGWDVICIAFFPSRGKQEMEWKLRFWILWFWVLRWNRLQGKEQGKEGQKANRYRHSLWRARVFLGWSVLLNKSGSLH